MKQIASISFASIVASIVTICAIHIVQQQSTAPLVRGYELILTCSDGHNCYYLPTSAPGVLRSPASISATSTCLKNIYLVTTIGPRSDPILVARCEGEHFLGEFHYKLNALKGDESVGYAFIEPTSGLPIGEAVVDSGGR